MQLIIVESPSKAKTIEKYLGKGYRVIGSGGHIRDLPEKTLGIDIKNDFEPKYVIKDKMKKTIAQLKKEVEKADKVYLATDPDREGEAISWHLKELLNIDTDKSRIVFNEISKNAIIKALDNPRDIDMKLVNAQQARRVLDRLVGYLVSPIISRKIKSGLSAGRVQSAALKMIVDKEKEINKFVPEEYWNMAGLFLREGDTRAQSADFNDVNGKKIKITNKEENDLLLSNLEAVKDWHIDYIKKGKQVVKAKPPYTTSTLQQEASQRLNSSTSYIMSLAQKLYEGVDINGERIALVTYIRTDSVRVSNDAVNSARDYILNNYGKDYLPAKPNYYKNKNNSQDAHEAIRPISIDVTPDSLEGKLENKFLRLYKLIYNRFIASQMTPAEYNTLNIRIKGGNENYGFKMTGRVLKFEGHTAILLNNSDNQNILPNYKEGERLKVEKFNSVQKFTQPPNRYSESTLVKAMEENGIGRPSTYAAVIATLNKRFYVEKEKRTLKATEIGFLVCEVMEKFFPDIIDLKFTAKMEDELDIIDQGREWKDILYEFYPTLNDRIQSAKNDSTKYKPTVIESDIKCEKCGSVMVIRTGKYGKFYACSAFPKCRNIKPYDSPVTTCPKCGGDIYKKRSKKGKVFYGCSNYPNCDFVSWNEPAPILCAECGNIMTVDKKNGTYVCTDKKCGNIVKPKDND